MVRTLQVAAQDDYQIEPIAMDVNFKKAQASDAPAIWSIRKAAIYKGCKGFYPDATLKTWAEAPPTEKFQRSIERNCYLAMIDGHIAGFGNLDLTSGYVGAMFVDPAHMRQSVGKQILGYLEDLARAAGLKQLHLDASLNAVPVYRACGYTGEQTAKYQSPTGVTLECVKMAKTLT
jgi:GNAT superfamily N-acetyltransferase